MNARRDDPLPRDRCAARDHGHPHRRSDGDDQPGRNSTRTSPGWDRPRHASTGRARRLRAWIDLQGLHRGDGLDSGVIKSVGQIGSCPGEAARVGPLDRRYPSVQFDPCSVAEIMQESSNVGTAQIADQLGAKRQKEFLKKIGFLDPLVVELKERGRTLSPRDWSRTDVMTVGFGHSIAITPLHLASGYAALMNGGIWRPATLLKVDRNHPAGAGRRVFSEDTSYKMRSLLRRRHASNALLICARNLSSLRRLLLNPRRLRRRSPSPRRSLKPNRPSPRCRTWSSRSSCRGSSSTRSN